MAPWWRHQMEIFSALLAFVRGIHRSGWIPHTKRPGTRSFDVFFDLRLNKRLSKQSWGWWLETPSRSLRRHCNASLNWDIIRLAPSIGLAPSHHLNHCWFIVNWVWLSDNVIQNGRRYTDKFSGTYFIVWNCFHTERFKTNIHCGAPISTQKSTR